MLLGTFFSFQHSVSFCGNSNNMESALITSLLLCDMLTRAVARLITSWSARNLSSSTAIEMLLSTVVQYEAWSAHKSVLWFNHVLLLFLDVSC